MTKEKSKIGNGMIGLLAVFGVCGYIASDTSHRMDKARRERAAEDKKFKEDLEKCGSSSEVVSVKDVMAMMETNEAKVSRMWKGSCVKVSGVIKSIDEGPLGGLVVLISDGSRLSLHNIHCKPVSEEKALELSAGNPITAWGVGGNEIMGSLFLDSCNW